MPGMNLSKMCSYYSQSDLVSKLRKNRIKLQTYERQQFKQEYLRKYPGMRKLLMIH